MSLITDALKTAGRERSGRAQSERDAQPLIDGFFPYVASSPTPSRSRYLPIAAIASIAIALVAVIGWVTYKTFAQPRTQAGASIVLPPPASIQAPAPKGPALDRKPSNQSPSVAQNPVTKAAAPPTSPQSSSSVPPRVTPPATRIPVGSPAVVSARLDTIAAPMREVLPASAASRPFAAPVRPDYEAQATALFNAGDLWGARERLQLATRVAPTARAWTNYGVTLQRLGDLSGAGAAYQSAIGLDANYLEAWLYQGRLAAHLGDVAKAIPMFQRARAINPRNSEVNIELSRLEFDAKNWMDARRFAEDAVRGDPSNSRAHWYVAVSADQLRDSDAAIREYAAYLQTVGAAEREQAQFVGYARERLIQLRGRS